MQANFLTLMAMLILGSPTLKASRVSDLYKKNIKTPNPVFEAKASVEKKEDELDFVVEVLRGTTSKFELRTASGQLMLDRELCPITTPTTALKGFPVHYGIAPGYFNIDGDPLDVVVFGGDSIYKAMVDSRTPKARKVRVIGLLRMEECDDVPCLKGKGWKKDWKIVGVDPSLKNVKKITDLPAKDLAAVKHFFSYYKGAKKGHPQTRVLEYGTKQESLKYIAQFKKWKEEQIQAEAKKCDSVYKKVMLDDSKKPEPNKEFIDCLVRRVPWVLIEDSRGLKALGDKAAYHLYRVKLGRRSKSLTIDNAIEKMKKRKSKGKKHYRFVVFDQPSVKKEFKNKEYASSGSGQFIGEWVKTKNRNIACQAGFPDQHYEDVELFPRDWL